jgi:hypothetical protein
MCHTTRVPKEKDFVMHNMDTRGSKGTYLDRDIASAIGCHFFNVISTGKEFFSDYKEMVQRCKDTSKLIDSFRIINIHFDGKDICITTSRPGLLIGRKGEQINKLTESLRKEFVFDKISIIEDHIICNLQDFHYVLSGYEEDEE